MKWTPEQPTLIEQQNDVTWARRYPHIAERSARNFIEKYRSMGYRIEFRHPRPSIYFLVAIHPNHTGHEGVMS
jgi:hypothetical protein